jgi:hypothetical protein
MALWGNTDADAGERLQLANDLEASGRQDLARSLRDYKPAGVFEHLDAERKLALARRVIPEFYEMCVILGVRRP